MSRLVCSNDSVTLVWNGACQGEEVKHTMFVHQTVCLRVLGVGSPVTTPTALWPVTQGPKLSSFIFTHILYTTMHVRTHTLNRSKPSPSSSIPGFTQQPSNMTVFTSDGALKYHPNSLLIYFAHVQPIVQMAFPQPRIS